MKWKKNIYITKKKITRQMIFGIFQRFRSIKSLANYGRLHNSSQTIFVSSSQSARFFLKKKEPHHANSSNFYPWFQVLNCYVFRAIQSLVFGIQSDRSSIPFKYLCWSFECAEGGQKFLIGELAPPHNPKNFKHKYFFSNFLPWKWRGTLYPGVFLF